MQRPQASRGDGGEPLEPEIVAVALVERNGYGTATDPGAIRPATASKALVREKLAALSEGERRVPPEGVAELELA